MTNKDFIKLLTLQFKEYSYQKHYSSSGSEIQYFQGKLDCINDLLVSLGHSRLDSSDEMMFAAKRFRSKQIISDRWHAIPSA